jgi:hypothetical protein
MYSRLVVSLALITFSVIPMHSQTLTEPPVYGASTTGSTTSSGAEDWTTISLTKSGLPLDATGGTLLSKIDRPECTRELVRLQWRPGDPIDLYVIRPHGIEKPPVILYLYNYTSDTDVFRGENWCKQVSQNGVAAAGFVSALSGQRFHSPRPMKQWFVSELQEALSTSTHDVQMVLNYLDTRGDLDMKHVGMFGQGSGGSVAVLAAAADPRIVALDVIDPWGDWPDWLKGSRQIPEDERVAYLTPEFLRKVSNLDPVTYLPQLKLKALSIELLMDDPITPPAARTKIAAAVPNPDEVTRYQNLAAKEKAQSSIDATGWLEEQLRPKELSSGTR